MLDAQTQPLQVAASYLKPETIRSLRGMSFGLREWRIVDRWALSSPQALRALEQAGAVVLMDRILTQARAERAILQESDVPAGMSDIDILRQMEITLAL